MRLASKDVQPRADISLNKKIKQDGGVMTFGENDDYPNLIENIVASSVTASATANIYAKFLTGGGFEQEGVNDMVIGSDYRGKEVRMLDLLRLCAESVSVNNGVYLHLPMNAEGKIKDPTIQPFKFCRFSKVDEKGYTNSILYNRTYGQKDSRGKSKFDKYAYVSYPIFNNSKEVVLSQIEAAGGIDNFRGQMYFQYWDNRYLYPLSPFDPVYLDADTEWQVSLYKNRELRNGFMLRYILRVAQFENEREREMFIQQITNSEGADGTRVIALEDEYDQETGEIKESGAFKIEKLDANVNDKLFENWELSLSNKIRKANKSIPAVLLDYETSQLGSTSGEAITQAANFYNQMTEDDRSLMSRMFSEVMKNHADKTIASVENWKIKPLTFGNVSNI